jgi:acyl-CoA thioesterase-1
MAANEDRVLLALGDSLTAGYGLDLGQAWPEQVQDMLRKDGYDIRVVNAGVSGDTSAGGLARLDWALQDKPAFAVVALGANDMLRGLSPETMQRNLEAILTKLEQRGVCALLAGMHAAPNLGRDYVQRYNAVFPRLAEKHGAYFYPFLLQDVAAESDLNLGDGIHPNEAGARRIAEGLYPLIEKMIKQGCPAKK